MIHTLLIVVGIIFFIVGGIIMPPVSTETRYNRYDQDRIDKEDNAMILMLIGVVIILSGIFLIVFN